MKICGEMCKPITVHFLLLLYTHSNENKNISHNSGPWSDFGAAINKNVLHRLKFLESTLLTAKTDFIVNKVV